MDLLELPKKSLGNDQSKERLYDLNEVLSTRLSIYLQISLAKINREGCACRLPLPIFSMSPYKPEVAV